MSSSEERIHGSSSNALETDYYPTTQGNGYVSPAKLAHKQLKDFENHDAPYQTRSRDNSVNHLTTMESERAHNQILSYQDEEETDIWVNDVASVSEFIPNTWKNCRIDIVSQPESQHRARYLTEGSRGPIKNRKLDGFPQLQLTGWKGAAILEVFVASNLDTPRSHLCYQVCLVSTRNNHGRSQKEFDNTSVIQLPFQPNIENRIMDVDCIGLVKLRNSDVDSRVRLPKEKKGKQTRRTNYPSDSCVENGSLTKEQNQRSYDGKAMKVKSSSARLVYRALLISENKQVEGVLQVVSDPILCTQLIGWPEIHRMSIHEAPETGDVSLIIIGKNFVRGSRVVFLQQLDNSGNNSPNSDEIPVIWRKEMEPHTDLFCQTHIVCQVPSYEGPSASSTFPIEVNVFVDTRTFHSRMERFLYTPVPLCGPPQISRLSRLGAFESGDQELFIIGNYFEADVRVVFRELLEPSVDDQTESKILWQRDAEVDHNCSNQTHLVCHIPEYNGPNSPLSRPLEVQIMVHNSNATSYPKRFLYHSNARK